MAKKNKEEKRGFRGRSRILLIRHGITEGNKKRWFYGAVDIPLLPQGEAGLKRLRDRGMYPQIPEDAQCFTSELKRTEQTLDIIYPGHQKPRKIADLNEMNFGIYECHDYNELKDDPEFQKWVFDQEGDVVPEGGESRNQFRRRVEEGWKYLYGQHRLKEWSHRHGGEDAVTVAVIHGGAIGAIMQHLWPGVNGNMYDWTPEPGRGYVLELKEGDLEGYEEITEIKKLGFGLMRLPRLAVESDGNKALTGPNYDMDQLKKMVDAFMEKGYTYFDTAWGYDNGGSEKAIKEALVDRYPRDSFHLATKLPAWLASSENEAKAMFHTSLERMGTEYIDYYLLHNLGEGRSHAFDEYHIWDYLLKEKMQGKIRKLGFSFHDKADVLKEILKEHAAEMDFIQLQLNYADWESPRVEARKCYEAAREYGLPIVVMEPVKGGNLAMLPPEAAKVLKDAAPDKSLASWAMRFAMGLPGVFVVLSGMSSLEQMEDNLATAESFQPLNGKEKEALKGAADVLDSVDMIRCTYCRYCTKGCPAKINIPGVFRASNVNTVYGNLEGARGNYGWETSTGGKAGDCIQCGQCESVCPQQLPIIEYLAQASALFDEKAED